MGKPALIEALEGGPPECPDVILASPEWMDAMCPGWRSWVEEDGSAAGELHRAEGELREKEVSNGDYSGGSSIRVRVECDGVKSL